MPDPSPAPPSPGTAVSWADRLTLLRARLPRVPAPAAAAAAAAAAVGVAVVVVVVFLRSPSPAPALVLPRAEPSVPPGSPGPGAAPVVSADVRVHVAGAVLRPGVYEVRGAGRVADLLDAAGGPTPEADLDRVNLAARVADGVRLYVPRQGEPSPPVVASGGGGDGGGGDAGSTAEPVDLNAASRDQLDELPGVGPATASAIIEYRDRNGAFRSVEELVEVRGIGEAKLAGLRSRVRV